VLQELVTEAPNISEEAVQLMKFHGSYMQVGAGAGAGGCRWVLWPLRLPLRTLCGRALVGWRQCISG